MTDHDRRTFIRALGLGTTGALVGAYATGGVAGETTTTIEGGGYDIWNDRDEFHYYYTELDGDFDVRVRVDSLTDTDDWARAGLMVRQTLNDDAEHAMVRKTPGNETSFQWRSDDGSEAQSTTSGGIGEAETAGGTMAASWQRLVRSGDTIEAYGSTDGENWTLIADVAPDEIDFAGSAYVGLAVCSHDEGTLATAEFSNLSGLSPDSNRDVGTVDVAGSVSASGGDGGTDADAPAPTTTMEGGGYDVWNARDEFHYYYTELDGDFDVTVRVDSLTDTDDWARAGLMVRQTLNDDAEHAMIRKTPGHDTSLQWRSDDGVDAQSTTSGGTAEAEVSGGTVQASWQRLVRSGDTIEAYGSTDGSDWTLIADISPGEIDFAGSAYVGLAVCSHDRGTLTTAQFSNLSGLSPDSNRDIGPVEVGGSVSTSDGNTGGGGTGDTDPVVSTGSAAGVDTDSATLSGSLDDLGGAASADAAFEYRETGGGWAATAPQTLSSTGSYSESVSGLSAGTDYEFRATVDASDGDTDTGSTNGFTTASDGGGETPSGSGSYVDYEDGFADASWFDDSVTVHRVTEATRNALEAAVQGDSGRLVVFETSGTIDLGGDELEVTADRCWIAGQTAPSPGVTLTQGLLQVNANDVVVQHIRSRVGPGDDGSIQGNDSINCADGTTNTIFDHCTASWGVDECMSVGYNTTDTTVANCLVYEGLYDPYGDGEDHNYATLVGDGADTVALLGNVWAKTRGRVPRLKSDTRSVVANNVMYFFNEATNMDGDTEASIVGNVYAPQDLGDTAVEGGTAYLEDNVTDPSSTPLTGGTSELSSRPLWPSGFSAMPSGDVESHTLNYAGARPADRTSNDARIVSEIDSRAGDQYTDSPYDYWIADEEAVGGYPQLPENTHSLSPPSSGLREWIDQWALAVEEQGASPP